MANEIGTTLLNSLTNSTFDIGNMSKVLAEAEVAGPKAILESNRDKTNTELNALTYLQSNVSAFKTYLQDLSNPDTFMQSAVSSSNDAVVSGTVTGSVVSGSYQIEARQLAQANTQVANKIYSSASDTISSGTLSISIAGSTHNITVDATNNTLEGLQKTINSGDYGVNASIINTGNGYQLMFTSQNTGAANEMQISGLADFDTNGLTTTSVAQDAIMVVNGLAVTSSTNQFDEVIPGMQIDLKSAQPGTVNTLSVNQDTNSVVESIQSFVDVYNQLDTILDELGSYESLTSDQQDSEEYEYWGDLAGSSLLRQVRSELQTSLRGTLDQINSPYNSLSVIGLSIDLEGQMSFDQARFEEVAASNLDALKSLFSKGGSSDDPLVNVLSGNDRTQAGSYTLDITQLADRATVASGAVSAGTDQQVASGQVYDQQAVLTLDANAGFTMTTGASGSQIIDFSSIAGDYASKDDLVAAMQGVVDTAFGASVVSLSYDSTQSRFEFNAAAGQGSVSLSNVTGLSNQGFTQTDYTGENLINLAADGSFDFVIDDANSSTLTIAAGDYTLSELAGRIQSGINNNAEVQAVGASVSVSTEGGILNISSSRFGAFSNIDLSNFSGLANAGFADGSAIADVGQNVDGTITTATGTLNIGAYASSEDGRRINISDYAVIGTEPAEVRGLQFEVLGGATGARGSINFTQGFASRMEEVINNLFEDENGLVSQRIDSLNDKNTQYDEKQEKIDARYERLLMKYQLQFSALQSILSSAEQTRNYLTATFNSGNDN
ncbi:flagellar filament capping protein FliD [Thiomicrorhabdus xiamenensis]|uniref:Flagellar hook-associated protein 2 n=1 Tax=Thiomicrorhabdus xiamenensis TaxID=2739063 RepID=A0A7D4NZ39_9GAMM|nr:flagellar filament capping protein FliD [Thiomicrorhabdus xiamenensis]QKI89558.1 flagellar filament capping protein FliD [Thiomicrorhabdus xiamenensis]